VEEGIREVTLVGVQDPPQAPSEAAEQPGRVEPQPAVEGAQEAAQRPEGQTPRVPWWRRMFGG
jgi:hypothetical protein